ncbi:MAG: type II secretion system F family protein [Thermodesulfobacteriota bacterium]
MAIFSYKASDSSGKIVRAVLDAADESAAAARIQEMGLIPIRISPAGKQMRLFQYHPAELPGMIFGGIGGKDVMMFTQDLSALLEAGLPVDRALAILVEVTEKKKFKTIIAGMLAAVQGGAYLSDALAKNPDVFSDFYVNMVRAGEAGGVLEEVLSRLGGYLESSQDLKDFIKSALVYPVFLVCVSGISIIILITYVIPKFAFIFSDMGASIPLSSRLLLAGSELLRNYWWLLLGALILAVFGFRRYRGTEKGRMSIDSLKLRLPFIGELVKKAEVARFARTLGTLIRSGVPILQGIELVRHVLANQIVSQSMNQVHTRVKAGDRLSKTLEHAGVFPSLALQMITVGEETGRLEEMLLRVADNYEKSLRNLVKRFISLLEPALILLMAVVVGFIVISMLMAIFSMNELPF